MSAPVFNPYDLIPYPQYCFPQTHPERLALTARLLGLSPPPLERSRVLELGCASAANLVPMAEDLPDASFVGIDLSRKQIDEGRKAIGELGLSNVVLRHQSILDVDPRAETFDYIICHGVFSWVPHEVQERILDICRHSLQPDGVAYISYNTLPGWHTRGMIRDMMLYHGRRFSSPQEQITQARGLLDFLVSAVGTETTPYALALRAELQNLREAPDGYLFHETLEENNTPLYFHQFIERAASHGLRYLAEVELPTMDLRNFPEAIAQTIQRASNDVVQREQYMDFVRNRVFRQTLLCHFRHTPKSSPMPDSLAPFFIGSAARPVSASPDLTPNVREEFRVASGASAWSIYPIVKSALLVLGETWPQVLPFPELLARALSRLPEGSSSLEVEQQLRDGLLRFLTVSFDLVEFRLRPLRLTTRPGPQPRAHALARWQARSGRPVTNLRKEQLEVDVFSRRLLPLLDGQHTHEAVVGELAGLVEREDLNVEESGTKITNPERIRQVLSQALAQRLDQFAWQSLLLA